MRLFEVFQFVFDCRHRHLSRVFTIKGRTYKVCFDCAREFELPDAQAPLPSGSTANVRRGTSPGIRGEVSAP